MVPVSWERLTKEVVPEWIKTLLGQRSLMSYLEEFEPNHAADRVEDDDDDHSASWPVPPRYLEELGWTPGAGFIAADRLRTSELHQEFMRHRFIDECTLSLCRAVGFSASADLPEPDPFATIAPALGRAWGRLSQRPACQVAGTKNQYRFLADHFSLTWDPKHHCYDYVADPDTDPVLRGLLEALFLSTRAIPGTQVLARDSTWPAHDDPWLLGMLTPDEVQALVPHLGELERRQAAHDPNVLGARDELFPLFADRVRRAAELSLGLVALHAV